MRLTTKEKRLMERRMRHRLPPAMMANLQKKSQAAILIVTTLLVTPDAWARIASNTGSPVLTEAVDGRFTKTWSKDELVKTAAPVPVEDLSTILQEQVRGVMSRVTSSQNGNNPKLLEFRNRTKDDPTEAYGMNLALLQKEVRSTDLRSGEMRDYLRGQTEKAVGESIKSKIPFYKALKEGLSFNLNIGSWFGPKTETPVQTGQIRYGLIVQDIVPTKRGPAKAAINDSFSEDLRYAGQAEVKWTIGPVTELENRQIFTETPAAGESAESFWSRLSVPKPNFAGKIEPATADSSPIVTGKGLGQGLKFSMTQEDGLYQVVIVTTSVLKKDSMSHEFRIPVVGNMKIGRRLDDKFKTVQTSAYNVLIDKRAPIVNIHHVNAENRFRVEAAYERPGQSITAEAKMRPGFEPGQDSLGQAGEEYKINYNRFF